MILPNPTSTCVASCSSYPGFAYPVLFTNSGSDKATLDSVFGSLYSLSNPFLSVASKFSASPSSFSSFYSNSCSA